jgi:hypothetical protein
MYCSYNSAVKDIIYYLIKVEKNHVLRHLIYPTVAHVKWYLWKILDSDVNWEMFIYCPYIQWW